MTEPDRAHARRLAEESLKAGDPVGWFDKLYASAQGDPAAIPWADLDVNPNFKSWLAAHPLDGTGKRALVVGCGLGDDAEKLATLGFAVTAFDISPTAVDWCRRRFPASRVDYHSANLLAPPAEWCGAFDFVFEAYTLQALPLELRASAVRCTGDFLAPAGTLLVIARARDAGQDPGTLPWPLAREELQDFEVCGLETIALEDYLDGEDPPVRRFRVEFQRRR